MGLFEVVLGGYFEEIWKKRVVVDESVFVNIFRIFCCFFSISVRQAGRRCQFYLMGEDIGFQGDQVFCLRVYGELVVELGFRFIFFDLLFSIIFVIACGFLFFFLELLFRDFCFLGFVFIDQDFCCSYGFGVWVVGGFYLWYVLGFVFWFGKWVRLFGWGQFQSKVIFWQGWRMVGMGKIEEEEGEVWLYFLFGCFCC